MKDNQSHKGHDLIIKYIYRIAIIMLTLTGFAQMPIFKRYYIADIPGLGWLAEYYVTHYLHYLFAMLLLAVLAYILVDYLFTRKRQKNIALSGYIRMTILAGLIISGILLVIKNFPGYTFSPAFIIVIDICHVGLVMALLISGLVCMITGKKWMYAGV